MPYASRPLVSRRAPVVVGWLLFAAAVLASCGSDEESAETELLGELSPVERNLAWVLGLQFPETDFTIRTVSLIELVEGGPGRESGVRSIQQPLFEAQATVDWIDPNEPVIVVEIDGVTRAYPIQILLWHELVIDTLAGVPIAVTFCPLCNTSIVFDRRVDGSERRFGTSGLLRENDLIMFDFTTESLWQQITGEAIVGVDAGKRLDFIPSQIVSYEQFRQSFPDALVLSRDTGFDQPYGKNPYPGYDEIGSSTIWGGRSDDPRLAAKERVLTVEVDGDPIAIPFSLLEARRAVHARSGDTELVAFWQPDVRSPLGELVVAEGEFVGAAGAFLPRLGDRELTFEARGEQIVDVETGSAWNVLGEAVSGPLEGNRLPQLVAGNHFWFAWSVFKPETRVIRE